MSHPAVDPVSRTAHSYEVNAASWHAAHRDEQRGRTRRDSYKCFVDLVAPHGLVLDLGWGSGLDMPALIGRGLTVIGLDISDAMLRLAHGEVPRAAGCLLRGDIRALPLATSFHGWRVGRWQRASSAQPAPRPSLQRSGSRAAAKGALALGGAR